MAEVLLDISDSEKFLVNAEAGAARPFPPEPLVRPRVRRHRFLDTLCESCGFLVSSTPD